METITYPSLSAFRPSPVLPPPATLIGRQAATKKKCTSSQAGKLPTAKPKQSKSRNGTDLSLIVGPALFRELATEFQAGCVTCKAKRLKCDETKPTCLQCHKRNVECGGYKRDFKWRSFEETTFTSKLAPLKNRKCRLLLQHIAIG